MEKIGSKYKQAHFKQTRPVFFARAFLTYVFVGFLAHFEICDLIHVAVVEVLATHAPDEHVV